MAHLEVFLILLLVLSRIFLHVLSQIFLHVLSQIFLHVLSGVFVCTFSRLSGKALNPSNYLSYKSQVSEVLNTEHGEDLDMDCTRSYSAEAAGKADAMMAEISATLASSGCSDTVQSLTNTNYFSVLGSQVSHLRKFCVI